MTDIALLLTLLLVVVAAIVLLVVLLTRKSSLRGGAWSAERERMLSDLQAEREIVRTQASELGRIQGRLDASESEASLNVQKQQRFEKLEIELRQEIENARIELRTSSNILADRESALAHAIDRSSKLEADLALLRDQLKLSQTELAKATANLEHARRAQSEMQQFVEDAKNKLSAAFTDLAGKAFEERGQLFEKNVRSATAQGKVDIETLLRPFAEKLGEFRARVDTLYTEEARERSTLIGAVNELKTLNQDMAGHTAALTRALKGSARVRGDWGELMLESVLRGSGLEEGRHYERQINVADEDGRNLRPDILVRLPDDRCVVVDSKVNLIAWQEAMNSMDEPELHAAALQRHVEGLRRHVKDLGNRSYPKAVGETALDVTIAFVPIEGALSAALGFDSTLQSFAFERKVVFASPNTLMALLRVVDRLWARDKMQRQALEIGDAGGKVLDALIGFLTEFDGVGKKLEDANKAFTSARSRLGDSNQSVIKRAQRLVLLGARGRKALTEELRVDVPDLPQDGDGVYLAASASSDAIEQQGLLSDESETS